MLPNHILEVYFLDFYNTKSIIFISLVYLDFYDQRYFTYIAQLIWIFLILYFVLDICSRVSNYIRKFVMQEDIKIGMIVHLSSNWFVYYFNLCSATNL